MLVGRRFCSGFVAGILVAILQAIMVLVMGVIAVALLGPANGGVVVNVFSAPLEAVSRVASVFFTAYIYRVYEPLAKKK